MKTVTNGWVNLGKIVQNKKKDPDDPSEAVRYSLKLDNETSIEVTTKGYVDGQEVVIKRKVAGGSYFNISGVRDAAERKYKNNPTALKNQMDFIERNPYIKSEVSLGPDKNAPRENTEYDPDNIDY